MELTNDKLAKKLYETYNSAGINKWKNFAGTRCPEWDDLPQDIKDKWNAVASEITHRLEPPLEEMKSPIE